MGHLRRLWIEGPAGRLEALLRVACPARGGAVIAHPHPLHGGTMDNPVVFHVDRALHAVGLSTLRFNFRGVGTSEGVHDEGRGEVADVAAAVSWLRGVALAVPMVVVGYSFGAWCSLRCALAETEVAGFIGIGLPVRLVTGVDVSRFGRPLAVVQGTRDEFGTPAEVAQLLAGAAPVATVVPVPEAPHLFPARAKEVGSLVAEQVTKMIGAAPVRAAVS